MKAIATRFLLAALLASTATVAYADDYSKAVKRFQEAGESSGYFNLSYAYAVFPNVGKGGFIIAGQHGDGRVYEKGKHVADASITEVSAGLQAGGQEFSEVIFFQNKGVFDSFKGGSFELDAKAQATVITLAAEGKAGTDSSNASASTEKSNAAAAGQYQNGIAVFTIVKGGLMAGISVGGQKFKYKPLH